ncbi:MAG: hypothetical protein WCM76_12925 [Bacteroidota bacterium]
MQQQNRPLISINPANTNYITLPKAELLLLPATGSMQSNEYRLTYKFTLSDGQCMQDVYVDTENGQVLMANENEGFAINMLDWIFRT